MEDTHVWLMDAPGGNRRELVTIDNRQGQPQWSPDGRSVYFTVQERGSVATLSHADRRRSADGRRARSGRARQRRVVVDRRRATQATCSHTR